MGRMERKYLAHYLDASFGDSTANYVRLGKDLESYSEELNPQVDVRRNILGEQNVIHNGYQVQSTAEPFYADQDDELFAPIANIANNRLTGEDCRTTRVEVLVDETGDLIWAYKEDCWVVPNAVGGDTSGVQLPFNVYNAGNRSPGYWDVTNKTFTASSVTLNKATLAITGTGTSTVNVSALAPTAASVSGTNVVWASSNPGVATVTGSNSSATVTGVGNGTCVITATWFNYVASVAVTVTGN